MKKCKVCGQHFDSEELAVCEVCGHSNCPSCPSCHCALWQEVDSLRKEVNALKTILQGSIDKAVEAIAGL